jgi:hypothetical protein
VIFHFLFDSERGVSFQITVMKVLSGHPEGMASIADLTRCVAILMSSGADWTERMKRVAARAPDLDIFTSGYVLREDKRLADYGFGSTVFGVNRGARSQAGTRTYAQRRRARRGCSYKRHSTARTQDPAPSSRGCMRLFCSGINSLSRARRFQNSLLPPSRSIPSSFTLKSPFRLPFSHLR